MDAGYREDVHGRALGLGQPDRRLDRLGPDGALLGGEQDAAHSAATCVVLGTALLSYFLSSMRVR